jgi:dihydroxyacetone kinase-like predicted kinase
MKKALKTVKSGQVTFAIKDTVIDDVEITKDYFMGICDKKIKLCI